MSFADDFSNACTVNYWRFNMSRILKEMRTTMYDLYESGLVDKKTMRHFASLCLKSVHPLAPAEIKAIREKEQVSQAVFAACLNTSISSVRKWETGEKKPSGLALKLLNIIQKKGLSIIL
jgi:putative transcriptional regulator